MLHHPCLLKGADNVVYMSGRSLGLQVSVRPVMSDVRSPKYSRCYLGTKFTPDRTLYNDFYDMDEEEEGVDTEEEMIRHLLKDKIENDDSITWCQNVSDFKPVGACTRFGNGPHFDVIYQAASILVDIPSWSDSHRALGAVESQDNTSDETMEPSSKKMKSELSVDPSH